MVESDFIVYIPLTLSASPRVFTPFPGCADGVVGVAARVASVQVPWLTLEEEICPDLTNHIAALETMLSEMQLRVRQRWRKVTSEHIECETVQVEPIQVYSILKGVLNLYLLYLGGSVLFLS